jgi:hypothetical protein
MDKKSFTPFGYRYENGQCIVKIRLKPEKFDASGIGPLGIHTITQSGYIIFEAQFDLKGEQFKEFTKKMKEPAAK